MNWDFETGLPFSESMKIYDGTKDGRSCNNSNRYTVEIRGDQFCCTELEKVDGGFALHIYGDLEWADLCDGFRKYLEHRAEKGTNPS